MTTTNEYTFFRDGLKGKTKIYKGNWHTEDKTQPIQYQVTTKIMSSDLYYYESFQNDSEEEDMNKKKSIYQRYKEPILKANYTNLLKTKGIMKGYETEFPFQRVSSTSLKKDQWEFMDTLDHNKFYLWKTPFLNTSWKLFTLNHDQDEQQQLQHYEEKDLLLIAEFMRSTLDFKKQGTLIIYHPIPSYLLSCIILSHKIIHQLID